MEEKYPKYGSRWKEQMKIFIERIKEERLCTAVGGLVGLRSGNNWLKVLSTRW